MVVVNEMKQLVWTVILYAFVSLICGAPTNPESLAKKYLSDFGYLAKGPATLVRNLAAPGTVEPNVELTAAIKLFQSFNGLPQTGRVDERTLAKMQEPRCGVVDIAQNLQTLNEYNDPVWTKSVLTWRIVQYTTQLPQADQRYAMQKAFAFWSAVIPLDFVEARAGEQIDVSIAFGRLSHGDPWPFDGPSRVLAHATMPEDGRAHFDDDETWSAGEHNSAEDTRVRMTDLVTVAVHEFGHVLGLSHTRVQGAIMAPTYHEVRDAEGNIVVELDADDVRAIQELYGRRIVDRVSSTRVATPSTTTTKATPTTRTTRTTRTSAAPRPRVGPSDGIPPRPKRPDPRVGPSGSCLNRIDGIANGKDGSTYVFSQGYVWTLDSNGLKNRVPIADVFPNGPQVITAALYNKNTEMTMLFSGRQAYAYEWNLQSKQFTLSRGFPREITREVQRDPRLIFQWSDGNLVLVQDNARFDTWDEMYNVVTFSGIMSDYFPRIPDNASVAFHLNDQLHFLVDRTVHVYDESTKTVQRQIPLSDILRC